jgi:hypothetical protein
VEGTVEGGCLCGAVRFRVELPVKWCAHCHCAYCRRAHGAAFVTWVGARASGFRLTTGEAALRWYASSPGARRGFCGACGSTLFFEGDRWPDEVHVVLANIDGEVTVPPRAHVFFDQHVAWVELGDGLPRLGGATGVEPLTR